MSWLLIVSGKIPMKVESMKAAPGASQIYESSQFSFENQNSHDETLGEHLLWQLNLLRP